VEAFSMQDLIFRVTQLRPISGLKFDIFTGYRHNGENKQARIADSAVSKDIEPEARQPLSRIK
jgi:hypothetical protein